MKVSKLTNQKLISKMMEICIEVNDISRGIFYELSGGSSILKIDETIHINLVKSIVKLLLLSTKTGKHYM
jgi:hypothetical protein